MYMSSFQDGQTMAVAGPPGPLPTEPCSFHERRRCSWPTLGLIALGHALLLAALVMFDVIPIGPAKPKPLEIRIVPIEIAPPPPAAAPRPAHQAVVPTPIVAPPPIVTTPATPPVVAVTSAPPAAPSPVAAPAAVAAPSPTPGPVVMGRLAQMPGNPPLKYPSSARLRHQEGVVRLRILVASDGSVADIAIAQSSGFDVLDKAAVDVVRRWHFQPPTRDGVPVEGVGIFPAAFKLAAA
jgi:protein TonB